MTYQLFVVGFVVNVKLVPQVSACHYASETEVFRRFNVVRTYTPKCIYMSVDKSLSCRCLQFIDRKCCGMTSRTTVKNTFEKDIFSLFPGCFQFFYR